ncbi:MAG TPA: hypothetical protein PKA39_01965 [Ignavibacteria bacterium]|nr:hypothetical protein [Ignavibacteria bacterium]
MNNNDQLNLLRIFALVSGILNIAYALGWSGYTIIGGLITCGFGCLFGAVPVLNIIAAIMDFIVYSRLTNLNRSGTYSSMQFAGVFDIISVLTGNIFSMCFGIVMLIVLNNEEAKQYLREKQIY